MRTVGHESAVNAARAATRSFPRKSDVRTQSLVLCVCLTAITLVNLSTRGPVDRAGQIKGADFIGFYVLGSVARGAAVARLYDPTTERQAQVRLIPEAHEVQYLPVYGPQVYLFFSPFARWPFERALLIWTMISALIYGVCCAVVWRSCASLREDWPTVAIVAAANPAFFNLMLHGQSSALALAFITAAYCALKSGKPFLGGLAIGMLAYKPQLGIVAAAVFVIDREWRIAAGAIVAASAQLGVAWAYFGTELMKSYWQAMLWLRQVNQLLAIKPYQMHSLSEFWTLLLSYNAAAGTMYVISAILTIALSAIVWRSAAPLSLRYSMLLLGTALVSPHLYVYDLVILAPAFLLITDWTLVHADNRFARPMQLLVYLCYALPLIGVAAQFTHVQLSVVAMGALCVVIARAALRSAGSGGDDTAAVGYAVKMSPG